MRDRDGTLTELRAEDATIAIATDLVHRFLAMLRRREGDQLPE